MLIDGDTKQGSLCAFEEGFHVGFAFLEEQLGPQCAVLKEGSAPMAAHESGTQPIVLGREVCRDEGKDIHWDAVDGGESVPPFADGCQCGRGVTVKLRNGI